ncbi:MAG: succinate dehydrogenase hydrophobic membrane anchor subunit [Aquiluna sp.]|nr:succinate dehydrogenase hydrophobic membrane anchor subunit [Aquiluna sp.]MCF8546238.1 succinate dehydrogenase hydrophobic membrane anchor subunit [Aquiluna sp.]
MSVVIETPQAPRSRKAANWEKYGWLFMRVSGPLLVVLIFTHLVVNLVLGDGIKAIDFAFVGGKWADPFWQWWDLAMLWLALIHGTNGMRTIVNDYVEKPKVRKALITTLWAVAGVLILLGTLVIFTFDPCPANGAAELLPSFCPAR